MQSQGFRGLGHSCRFILVGEVGKGGMIFGKQREKDRLVSCLEMPASAREELGMAEIGQDMGLNIH